MSSRNPRKRRRSSSSLSPVQRKKPEVGKGRGNKGKGKGRCPSPPPIPPVNLADWSDTDEEKEFERLQAKAMRQKCLRDNEEQRRKLALEKKAREMLGTPTQTTVIATPPQTTVTPTGGTDPIAAALNTITQDDTNISMDTFEEALKLAQETFDMQSVKGDAINDAYARIVDSALR